MIFAEVDITAGAVLIATIGAASAIISPVLVATLTSRASRRRQQEDWDRQDQVAVAARSEAEAQRVSQDRLAEQANEAARLLADSDRRHAEDARRLETKIDQVHALVNSKLTESMEAQVHALAQLVDLMTNDIIRLGTDADPKAVGRRDVAKHELARLQSALVDRAAVTNRANENAASAMLPPPQP